MTDRLLLDGEGVRLTLGHAYESSNAPYYAEDRPTPPKLTGAYLAGHAATGAGARILATALMAYADELDRENARIAESKP